MVSLKPPWYLMVGVMVMAGPALDSSDSGGNCLVKKGLQMDEPQGPLLLLAYVTRSTSLTVGFIFRGVEGKQERDAVSLNSTGATHSEVRGGKATLTPLDLPRLIPEGWNTFNVTVAGKDVTMTLVQGQDHLTLLQMSLPRPVTRVHAVGTVAKCSTASPEWEVAAGRDEVVFLQPVGSEQEQWLELSSEEEGAASVFVYFPSSPNTMTPVPANTILRITSSLRGDYVLLRVFKDGDGGGEEVVEERASITPPLTMLVRSDGGDGDGPSVHLRLMLSQPLVYEAPSSTSSGAGSLGHKALGISLTVLASCLLLGAALYWWRRRNRIPPLRRQESRAKVIQETPASLSRQPDFKDRLYHDTTDGMKTLHLHLLPDPATVRLLNALLYSDVSSAELLLVNIHEASRFHSFAEKLPALPSIGKVKLDVAGFTERDLDKVCELVMKLQPSKGYATIDFQRDINSNNSGNGEVLRREAWEKLLQGLHDMEVKVKGRVWLPAGAITEERQKLLPLSFTYDCRIAG